MRLLILIFISLPFISSAQRFIYEVPELPKELSFASEKVPMDRTDVRENLMRELIINTYFHTKMLNIAMREGRYEQKIKEILEDENIPKDIYYVAVIESELDLNAKSYAGAVGIWQFLEETARESGLIVTDHIDQRKDPELATMAATKYLKKAYEHFGSWALAITSFNRGITGLKDALKSQKVDNFYDLYLHPQSARYYYRALAAKVVDENIKDYSINNEQFKEFEDSENYTTLKVSENIENLPDFAIQHGTNYKTLKELNPWMVNTDYRLIIPENTTLTVKIPK